MKSFASSSLFVGLILAIQAHGHALITPALGGGTARSDVKRPNIINPCGAGVNVASLIDSSQPVTVNGGTVDATITNFNAGVDGSRFVTAEVDPTGTGKRFQRATVTTNGDKNPTDVSSQPLTIQMPANLQASGGAAGNRMLISLKTLGGFGNCIAATTGAAAANTGNATTAATGTQQNQQTQQQQGTTGKQRKQRNRQFQKMKIRNAVEAIAEAN